MVKQNLESLVVYKVQDYYLFSLSTFIKKCCNFIFHKYMAIFPLKSMNAKLKGHDKNEPKRTMNFKK